MGIAWETYKSTSQNSENILYLDLNGGFTGIYKRKFSLHWILRFSVLYASAIKRHHRNDETFVCVIVCVCVCYLTLEIGIALGKNIPLEISKIVLVLAIFSKNLINWSSDPIDYIFVTD